MAISSKGTSGTTTTIRNTTDSFDGSRAWYGTKEDDVFIGGDGDDWAYGLGGSDYLEGNGGNDALNGGAGGDMILGGDGHDVIWGDDPAEKISLHGNDLLWGDAGDDQIFAGGGNDRVNGGTGDDVLWGEAGHDILNGGLGLDKQYGGAGFDIFQLDLTVAGEFATGEIYDGGAGTDQLQISNNPNSGAGSGQVLIDLASGVLTTDNASATIAGIENVQALGDNFAIFGSEANERLSVMAVGTDPSSTGSMIDGGGGDDVLIVTGYSNDVLFGGKGNDRIDAGDGNDIVGDGAGNDIMYGGNGDDSFNAVISEGTGNDIAYGGDGDDTYRDYVGNDTFYGGSGYDEVVLNGSWDMYSIQDLGAGNYIVTGLGSGEVDYYYDVERLSPGLIIG